LPITAIWYELASADSYSHRMGNHGARVLED